jgi:hypothetical protein
LFFVCFRIGERKAYQPSSATELDARECGNRCGWFAFAVIIGISSVMASHHGEASPKAVR